MPTWPLSRASRGDYAWCRERVASGNRAGEPVKADKPSAGAGFLDHFADQLDRAESRIYHIQARWVRQEIKGRAVVDAPRQGPPGRLDKPIQLPAAAAKGADVAD